MTPRQSNARVRCGELPLRLNASWRTRLRAKTGKFHRWALRRKAYTRVVEEMLERTSSEWAPWHLVEADSKRYARVKVVGPSARRSTRACAGTASIRPPSSRAGAGCASPRPPRIDEVAGDLENAANRRY